MIHQKKNKGHRTSKIVKSRQIYSNDHLPYHCSFYYLIAYLACTLMRDRGELIGVHSKDAQKQLARTSLSRHWRPCDRQVSALS